MYLNMLSNEQKHLFLDLEIYISKIDGEFSDEEKAIIDTHCAEMRIDNQNYIPELSLDELMLKLRNEFDYKGKRIVFLELTGTILADCVYDQKEKIMMNRLAKMFQIDQREIDEAYSLICDMKQVYKRCWQYIN